MNSVWDNIDFFEKLVAKYAGSKYAVAVDSCSNALFLCFKYCKDKKGIDKVLKIPKRTYISVPMQAMHAGYEIEFVDKSWTGAYEIEPIKVIDSAQRFTKGMYEKDTMYCLSFNFKKTLSTIKGGMILTDNLYEYLWLKKASNDGRPSVYYNDMLDKPVDELGYHMNMVPEQAVIGIQNFYTVNGNNNDTACSADYKVDLSQLNCFKNV